MEHQGRNYVTWDDVSAEMERLYKEYGLLAVMELHRMVGRNGRRQTAVHIKYNKVGSGKGDYGWHGQSSGWPCNSHKSLAGLALYLLHIDEDGYLAKFEAQQLPLLETSS